MAHRLLALRVKGVAIVDKPAIGEKFCVIKNQEEEDKMKVKTVDDINKDLEGIGKEIGGVVDQAKSAVEDLMEKEMGEDVRQSLTKVSEFLNTLADKELPKYEEEETKKSEEEDTKSEEKELKKEKDLNSGILSKDEAREIFAKKETDLSKSLEILQGQVETLAKSMETKKEETQIAEVMTKFGESLVALTGKIEDISKEVSKKANKDEVPIRKGVVSKEGERGKEEDETKQSNPISKMKDSDVYKKASPPEQLRLVTQVLTGENTDYNE